jgi:hypothetical protein
MSDLENARARAEALSAARVTSSADRARLWAGMNRYLAAEAQIAHSTPTDDEDEDEDEPEGLPPTEQE